MLTNLSQRAELSWDNRFRTLQVSGIEGGENDGLIQDDGMGQAKIWAEKKLCARRALSRVSLSVWYGNSFCKKIMEGHIVVLR